MSISPSYVIFNQLQDELLGRPGSSARLRYHDRSSRGRGISSTWSCSPLTPSSLHLGYRGCPRARRTQEDKKGLSPAVIHSPVPFFTGWSGLRPDGFVGYEASTLPVDHSRLHRRSRYDGMNFCFVLFIFLNYFGRQITWLDYVYWEIHEGEEENKKKGGNFFVMS